MMNEKKKAKYMGMLGVLLTVLLAALLLLLLGFEVPRPQEEGGMPVMLGQVSEAGGWADMKLTEVDVQPAAPEAPVEPPVEEPQELMTQESEESVAVKPAQKKPMEKKPTETKPKPVKTKEQIEAEARAKAEAEAEAKRKAAEEEARKKVTGAFGKGAQMGGQGAATGKGQQGSVTGNATTGASQGEGGYGSFSLGGRSLGPGGLPRPVYDVPEEGRVVVTITVNPQGVVVSTSIDARRTNTVNARLRRAAEDAARKARFNWVEGVNNQQGSITYYFNLK